MKPEIKNLFNLVRALRSQTELSRFCSFGNGRYETPVTFDYDTGFFRVASGMLKDVPEKFYKHPKKDAIIQEVIWDWKKPSLMLIAKIGYDYNSFREYYSSQGEVTFPVGPWFYNDTLVSHLHTTIKSLAEKEAIKRITKQVMEEWMNET